jgi:hypothetical protein
VSKFKVVQLKTEATAHVVIRNRAGKKLFEIYVAGISITVAVPAEAEIKVTPNRRTS